MRVVCPSIGGRHILKPLLIILSSLFVILPLVSTENHPQIAKRISPVPIKMFVNVNAYLKVKWRKLRIIMF